MSDLDQVKVILRTEGTTTSATQISEYFPTANANHKSGQVDQLAG